MKYNTVVPGGSRVQHLTPDTKCLPVSPNPVSPNPRVRVRASVRVRVRFRIKVKVGD